MVKLGVGHVVRRKDNHKLIGNVRHTGVSRSPDELEGDEVRVIWGDLSMRDTIEHPESLQVHAAKGRRLVWVDAH